LVGTGWLFRETGAPATTLRPPAGDVPVRDDAERTWIRARPEWVHPIRVDQLASVADVETSRARRWAYRAATSGPGSTRTPESFVHATSRPTWGILEDEATGAAAVLMGHLIGRPITIRQGVGSEILARAQPDGTIEIGGRVEAIETREYAPRQ